MKNVKKDDFFQEKDKRAKYDKSSVYNNKNYFQDSLEAEELEPFRD